MSFKPRRADEPGRKENHLVANLHFDLPVQLDEYLKGASDDFLRELYDWVVDELRRRGAKL